MVERPAEMSRPSGPNPGMVCFDLEVSHVQPEELDGDTYVDFVAAEVTGDMVSQHSQSSQTKLDLRSPASVKSDLRSLESFLPRQIPRQKVSGAFQKLVDQLVQQHMRELHGGDWKGEKIKASATKESMESGTGVDHKSTRNSFHSDASLASRRRGAGRGTASTTSAQLLLSARNRQGIPSMQAEQILGAFSPEETQSLGRVESLGSGDSQLSADRAMLREFFSETESAFTKRFQKWSRWEKIRFWLQSNQFEMMICGALCLNILWMAFQLQVQGSVIGSVLGTTGSIEMSFQQQQTFEEVFGFVDMLFAGFFGLEVLIRACVLGVTFWKSWLNYIDVAVSVISVVEMFVFMSTLGVNPVLFRLLRMGKLSRAMRVVSMTSVLASLQLLLKCLAASRDMLFWSFLLLTFVQCVAGMIVTTLCWEFIKDESQDATLREDVYRYYGTFTRTFLSMFEIMFANWSPPCRVLVEHVSEWFSIFFLLYRCVLGFAVLNVVNAVFVQQTMKTASSDEDIAFKQREKDIAMYNRKVKKLFATMDSSGDGAINFEEFSKLVKSPKLRFWMSQLELEYHDLLSLFEFLDNGDGNITLTEFIDGAARLRGSAKALDVWRMETKVEVLFDEVLHYLDSLRPAEPPPSEQAGSSLNVPGETSGSRQASPRHSSIQDIFNNSAFRHIRATTFKTEESTEAQGESGEHQRSMHEKSTGFPSSSKSGRIRGVSCP